MFLKRLAIGAFFSIIFISNGFCMEKHNVNGCFAKNPRFNDGFRGPKSSLKIEKKSEPEERSVKFTTTESKGKVLPEDSEKLYSLFTLNEWQRRVFKPFDVTEKEVDFIIEASKEFGDLSKVSKIRAFEKRMFDSFQIKKDEAILLTKKCKEFGNINLLALILIKLNTSECCGLSYKIKDKESFHELSDGQLSIVLYAVRAYRKHKKDSPDKSFFTDEDSQDEGLSFYEKRRRNRNNICAERCGKEGLIPCGTGSFFKDY